MIQVVNVFLHQHYDKIHVGRLAYKEGKIYFEYDEKFLKEGVNLSPYKVPLKSGVRICDDDLFEGLFGLFADSLPDGWGRLLLDRHFLKKSIDYHKITPLDRLSYIGQYGVGALSYEPIDEELSCSEESEISLDELAGASLEILSGSTDIMLEQLLLLGGSSAGARPKVMIQLSSDKKNILSGSNKLRNTYEHWMVKFTSSMDTKDSGKIEYIYSLLAKEVGIKMSETCLLKGKKESYFATKRFDRVGDRRVHIHSVAGLAHSDFRAPTLDYDDLLTLTLHLTKDVNELQMMFKIACFNLYMHNRDDHAKNFSFMLDDENCWKLAPAYDLTFSYGIGTEHSTMYLGEGKTPTTEHLLKLGKKHSIKDASKVALQIRKISFKFKEYAKEFKVTNSSSKLVEKSIENLLID
ncbi:MAG: type II toxin-antitoxin system HipA family toxin [Helicobacteraceae bacterium]|nr:type II toxin-antitoxin system HipA family toxin [Helicobacteraceae bacterium]